MPAEPVTPRQAPDGPTRPATEIAEVTFKTGYTATLADAPPGVVFDAEKGVLEWTPAPFSSTTEVRVLFALRDADGKEEFLVHTIRRK
jgi:hypothetical protein